MQSNKSILAGLAVLGTLSGNQSPDKSSQRRSKRRNGSKDDMTPCHGVAHDGTKVESAKGRIVGQAKDKFLIIASDGTNIGAHGMKRLYEIQVACQHGIDQLKSKQSAVSQ